MGNSGVDRRAIVLSSETVGWWGGQGAVVLSVGMEVMLSSRGPGQWCLAGALGAVVLSKGLNSWLVLSCALGCWGFLSADEDITVGILLNVPVCCCWVRLSEAVVCSLNSMRYTVQCQREARGSFSCWLPVLKGASHF